MPVRGGHEQRAPADQWWAMTVWDERFEALLGTAAPLVAAVFDALPDAIGVVWQIVDETGALVDFEVGYTTRERADDGRPPR